MQSKYPITKCACGGQHPAGTEITKTPRGWVAASCAEPKTEDGRVAIRGQHWSQRGHGPAVRLCAGGCGRRVSSKYAECYSCHRESLEAM